MDSIHHTHTDRYVAVNRVHQKVSHIFVFKLRSGGMFSKHFITNFPQNVPVKYFRKSVNIWRRYGQKLAAYFFGPPCTSHSGSGYTVVARRLELIAGTQRPTSMYMYMHMYIRYF